MYKMKIPYGYYRVSAITHAITYLASKEKKVYCLVINFIKMAVYGHFWLLSMGQSKIVKKIQTEGAQNRGRQCRFSCRCEQ